MTAERRQLTILNCDLVGSTQHADGLDPEDFESLIQGFFDVCLQVVARHRGLLPNHTGDGFVAYFGYPRSDGLDAPRAIECGLDIIDALQLLTEARAYSLDVRIGVATGLVVLSTIRGQGSQPDTVAFGSAAHRAARLQSLAHPGQVVVDEASQRLSMQHFDFDDWGEKTLKGFANAVRVWHARGKRSLGFRFEERLARLSPLVGRNHEIDLVMERWEWVCMGEGQGVVLSGEPGIGKSRLVFEICERVSKDSPNQLVLQCLENFENNPLHPLVHHLEHVTNIGSRDSLAQRRKKLETVLERWFPESVELRTFVLSLMSRAEVDDDDDSRPERKLEALYSVLIQLALERAREHPLVIVIEDVQWIDPTSAALVYALIERIAGERILLILTCRPEHALRYSYTHVTQLSLNRLSRGQVRTLAQLVMADEEIPESVLRDIVVRSDGIPLYVEEMARTVADTGDIGRMAAEDTDGNVATGAATGIPIPDSLQGSLLSRLDGVGHARELAQVAAVIGREFDQEILARLEGVDPAALEHDLDALVDAGVLLRRAKGEGPSFVFKHALIHEAAYKSLLHRDALALHERLGAIYVDEFPEFPDTRPEVLAHHATLSHQWRAAADLWLRAGLAARDTGSNLEAKNRLDRALSALDQDQPGDEPQRLRIRVQMARGDVINAHFGPAVQEAHDAYLEAMHLGETFDDVSSTVSAQMSLFALKYVLGVFPDAETSARGLIQRGRGTGNHQAAAIGLLGAGMCRFALGEFGDARTLLEDSLHYLDKAVEPAAGYPSKAWVYLALVEHIVHVSPDARELCARGVEVARGHRAIDLAAALGNSLYLHWMQQSTAIARRTCEELMTLSEKRGYQMWFYQGNFFMGWLDAKNGDERGLGMMEEAMERFRHAQEMVEQTFFYGVLAERYLALDSPQAALSHARTGLNLVSRYGERFFEAPLLMLETRCLERLGESPDSPSMREQLCRAGAIAERQHAAAWQRYLSAA